MVTIIVKEKSTNKPIMFVPVYIKSETQSWSTSTDANGIINVKLRDGIYIVKIRSPDHRPKTKKYYLSQDSILSIELEKAYE